MPLFDNEYRRVLLWLLLVSAIFIGIAFAFYGTFGIIMILFVIVIISLLLICNRVYTRRMTKLASSLQDIANGKEAILDEYKEGGFSILQIELQKLIVILKDQKESLMKDRIYLEESLADVSHQIRNPLTSVNLLFDKLRKPGLSEEEVNSIYIDIFSELRRIEFLVTALLKISKLDANTVNFNIGTHSLEDLIKLSTSSLLISMELHDISLTKDVQGDFKGDLLWTAEAITNIIKNSIEHTPDGGSIKVIGRETPIYSSITITDSGTGIKEKDLGRIFERFYRGDTTSNNNYGIGMALAHSIIVRQEGSIKASNSSEGGAQFEIKLYKTIV